MGLDDPNWRTWFGFGANEDGVLGVWGCWDSLGVGGGSCRNIDAEPDPWYSLRIDLVPFGRAQRADLYVNDLLVNSGLTDPDGLLLDADGTKLALTSSGGVQVLHYGKLAVTDADGRTLPSRLELLRVDFGRQGLACSSSEVAGARYHITVDPLASSRTPSRAATMGRRDMRVRSRSLGPAFGGQRGRQP